MICSGYVLALSLAKKNTNIYPKSFFDKSYFINRFLRLLIPFCVVFVSQEIIFKLFKAENCCWFEMLNRFLCGGRGPGSYYIPLMFQLVFLFPCLFFLIKRIDYKGLWVCFFACFSFEILKTAYGMNVECYRLLIFRYLFLISYGCYMAIGKKTLVSHLWLFLLYWDWFIRISLHINLINQLFLNFGVIGHCFVLLWLFLLLLILSKKLE